MWGNAHILGSYCVLFCECVSFCLPKSYHPTNHQPTFCGLKKISIFKNFLTNKSAERSSCSRLSNSHACVDRLWSDLVWPPVPQAGLHSPCCSCSNRLVGFFLLLDDCRYRGVGNTALRALSLALTSGENLIGQSK